jgi:uncharacterized protein (UPF0333 family)
MIKRMRNRRGQSILEYLVIVTVIILALAIARPIVQGNMTTMFTNAATQTSNANTALGAATWEAP